MSRDLSLLEPEFRGDVEGVLGECEGLGVTMRPFFTLRDPFEQARLWRQSRPIMQIMAKVAELEAAGAEFLAHVLVVVGPQFGRHVTNAIPGLSWHQWGEAVDCFWLVDGEAEWSTRKKRPIADGREVNGYRLYGELAVEAGLTSGGFWTSLKDWPHLQKRSKGVRTFFDLPAISAEMEARFGGRDA